MSKRVYISGKITGLEPNEVRRIFARAEERIKSRGDVPVNPALLMEFFAKGQFAYEHMLDIDCTALNYCDVIYMLNNYKDSTGAMRELRYAQVAGMIVEYER